MVHRNLRNMLDEMLNDPEELFITSASRRCALISLKDGTTLFIEGDFSGNEKENEAEARRILNDFRQNTRRINGDKRRHR